MKKKLISRAIEKNMSFITLDRVLNFLGSCSEVKQVGDAQHRVFSSKTEF